MGVSIAHRLWCKYFSESSIEWPPATNSSCPTAPSAPSCPLTWDPYSYAPVKKQRAPLFTSLFPLSPPRSHQDEPTPHSVQEGGGGWGGGPRLHLEHEGDPSLQPAPHPARFHPHGSWLPGESSDGRTPGNQAGETSSAG